MRWRRRRLAKRRRKAAKKAARAARHQAWLMGYALRGQTAPFVTTMKVRRVKFGGVKVTWDVDAASGTLYSTSGFTWTIP